MSKTKKRVLSGIRATGQLHLGNYLGAVKGMLALQDDPDFETFYMVADAHTITTPYDSEELRQSRQSIIVDYLAAGLDPEKSVLFLQSEVPAHFELAFYFSSLVSVAKMQHLPTFKDKVKQYPASATMALLNYPVLMAADILLYRADQVPVGIDQEPHIEIAREIARKCNATYGTDFPEPVRFKTSGEYIPSLTGEGKMSKSVAGSFINLSDDLATIKKKIAKVPTDAGKGIIGQEPGGVKTLFTLTELFAGAKLSQQYEQAYQNEGLRYGDVKNALAEAIFADLVPIQEKIAELLAKPEYLQEVINNGRQKAQEAASETMTDLKTRLGLS